MSASTNRNNKGESSAESPVHHQKGGLFQSMQLYRKRKRSAGQQKNILSIDSSESSSDEDEVTILEHHQQQQQPKRSRQQQQQHTKTDSESKSFGARTPEGWRVKLYRLNNDGSWDDCGTGRIVCLYKGKPASTKPTTEPPASSSSLSNSSDLNPDKTLQEEVYHLLGEPTLCMHAETTAARVLLRTRILLRDAYQRQGDNIITWCEPFFEEQTRDTTNIGQGAAAGAAGGGVDLALSFQDNAGCLDIWRQITHVQSKAADFFRGRGSLSGGGRSDAPSPASSTTTANNPTSVTDMAQAVAAAHHASLQRQQQHAMWVNVASEANQQPQAQTAFGMEAAATDDDPFHEQDAEAVAVSMAAAAAAAYQHNTPNQQQQQQQMPGASPLSMELPNPPTLQNLEEVADMIAAAKALPQRESLALYISQKECAYLLSLLSLFPAAESKSDYGALATLAACIKTVLLLNDPPIIEHIIQDSNVYEQVCSSLEYDPDLRDKANHRWFLRERAKFRTVVLMENEDLVATIHRSFRVTYLRDTLLRPTMDESSLSTLSSLQTFTHADVVKGVTCPSNNGGESYLIRVMRMLGTEISQIADMEWQALEQGPLPPRAESPEPTAVVVPSSSDSTTSWKQHLAPQDGSLGSRKVRRRGCLSFFKELFNMVRVSLQQNDKDDFYAAIVNMEVDLKPSSVGLHRLSLQQEEDDVAVNLLSMLGAVLADPTSDPTEKGSCLEIIASIAMHDTSLIRRHCLEFHELWKRAKTSRDDMTGPSRPLPNERRQVIFQTPPNDLLSSLLFLMAVETDAGVLLQTAEIVRVILDTDMFGEHSPLTPFGADETDGFPSPGIHGPGGADSPHGIGLGSSDSGGDSTGGSDQNQFLSLFYEHYIAWLVGPFQYTIVHPIRRFPDSILRQPSRSSLLRRIQASMKRGAARDEKVLKLVHPCAIRGSFAVELLSFCVRAHLHRMKFYLLRSGVLGSVLKLVARSGSPPVSGDRCLKLGALRLLRAILSVKDELYHRHIIQHNLFAPVFEAFRANPVGDNLVSSSIVEMCDFISNQNITSLMEYIVSRHLSEAGPDGKTLEEVASPYVTTLALFRKRYEENQSNAFNHGDEGDRSGCESDSGGSGRSRYFQRMVRNVGALSEKAMEDQRKFHQVDAEESYFDDVDDEPVMPPASNVGGNNNVLGPRPPSPIPTTPPVDEVDTGKLPPSPPSSGGQRRVRGS